MLSTIKMSGPLFDGVAQADLETAIATAQTVIAKAAEAQWQENMTASFRNPSTPPKYQSYVNIARRDSDLVVNDGYPGSDLKYGPWLEGVSPRNSSAFFKGYSSLRRAAAAVRDRVPSLVKPIVDAFITKANGV